jgi:hypothetical protein
LTRRQVVEVERKEHYRILPLRQPPPGFVWATEEESDKVRTRLVASMIIIIVITTILIGSSRSSSTTSPTTLTTMIIITPL